MTNAKITLQRSRLSWGENVTGHCRLENEGEDELRFLNYANKGGLPSFVLTDVETGEATVYGVAPDPWEERSARHLEVGSASEEEISALDRFPFPKSGQFDLRARYHWFRDGEPVFFDSEPFRVEVLPAAPKTLAVGSASGALDAAQQYAIWVDGGANALWLSPVMAMSPPAICHSENLGPIPPGAQPFLAVPALESASARMAVWVEGAGLTGVVHERGETKRVSAPLPEGDYRVIGPPLQTGKGADVLLLREAAESWELCVAGIGEGARVPVRTTIPGPAPATAVSVHGAGGARRTVFFRNAADPAGEPVVLLGLSAWRADAAPAAPELLASFGGRMVACDFALRADNVAVGAALMKVSKPTPQYTFHCWSVSADGKFRSEGVVPLRWEAAHARDMALATMRVNQRGEPAVLFQDSEKEWSFAGPNGIALAVKPELQGMAAPVALLWVEFVHPAILYYDPGNGLRIGYFSSPPRSMPMVSAGVAGG